MKRHVIAVVGGAVAGSEAAALCAARGALVVVFEQGPRPYGKIEGGLPRWHAKLREKEFRRIDANLSHPNVRFVPCTKIGEDLSFEELRGLGFGAVILANGAWRDRPLPIDGIDRFVGKGLVYQNPFVYWFNHGHEPGYEGPVYETPEGAVVIGGGLASIDVAKILSLSTHARAIRAAGRNVELDELEQGGIGRWCAAHGVDLDTLGVDPPTLYYRRRMEDMPLASPPPDATEEQLEKTRQVRVKVMRRVMERYRVRLQTLRSPIEAIAEGERLVGMRFQVTEVVDGRVRPVEGETEEVYAPLFVSSIGSIPEPLPGIPMKGELYDFANWETGEIRGLPGVFGLGNVLTGQGNIRDSRLNAQEIARGVLEGFLTPEEVDASLDQAHAAMRARAEPVVAAALATPEVDDTAIDAYVHRRWEQVGYPGDYAVWIAAQADR